MLTLRFYSTIFITCVALLSSALNVHSQYRWDMGATLGTGNYLGDIGGEELTRRDLIFDLHVDKTKFSTGAFVRHRFSNVVSVKGSFGVVFIEDADAASINRDRVARNAHFRNRIFETSIRAQGIFWYRPNMLPYKFRRAVSGEFYGIAGLSYIRHNPQAQISRDAVKYQYSTGLITTNPNDFDYEMWYDLRPYQTEDVAYSKGSIAIPLGLGAAFTINKSWRVALEMIWSVTFTDYLDDVSTTYANTENLDDIGRVLSSPTNLDLISIMGISEPEVYIQNHQYSANYQSPRGNSSRNDAYGTLQLSVSKIIKNQSRFSHRNYGKKKKKSWTFNRSRKTRGYNKRGRARF